MKKKLSTKQILIISSTWFGTIFGAGNLIFPVHLGQLAGNEFLLAAIGFIVTAVGLPIISVFAILVSKSNGLFDFVSMTSKKFAYFFSVLLFMSIGPCFVVPRSALISYNSGLQNIVGSVFSNDVCRVVFCALFFIVVLLFTLHPSKITVTVGKIINPVFLLIFGTLIVTAFIMPISDATTIPPNNEAYEQRPFFNGFLQGYGTMDVFSCLCFGIILVNIVNDAGITSTKQVAKSLVKPAVITTVAMSVIYLATIIMGAQSCGIFEASSNGSIALSQISNHYFGLYGDIILFLIVSLASLKTDIGLMTSCSKGFSGMFPKVLNYNKWSLIFICLTFIFTLFGLDAILEVATPLLSFLYPVCMVFLILAFIGRLFNYDKLVYNWTISFTCLAGIFDFISNIPLWIVEAFNMQNICAFTSSIFPFTDVGFSWVLPAFVGFIIGIILYNIKRKKSINTTAKK